MSTSNNHNVITPLRRMGNKLDETNAQIEDFMRAQAAGEEPDPDAFAGLLEKKMTINQAQQAQLKLNEKPLKTVLGDVR